VANPPVKIAGEGDHDLAIARRLLGAVGLTVAPSPGALGGKSKLDPRIPFYCQAAARDAWFVLRDLDRDAPCAGGLVTMLAPHRPERMVLRVPVRSVEAWLLADRTGIARFLRVPEAKIPRQPDQLESPKTELVNVARKSKVAGVRDDIVPREGATRPTGPAYTLRLVEFTTAHWAPERARESSPSLERAMRALERLKAYG
jgi:hypothetical protein